MLNNSCLYIETTEVIRQLNLENIYLSNVKAVNFGPFNLNLKFT